MVLEKPLIDKVIETNLLTTIDIQMGRKLWGGEAIGEDTPGLKRSRINKQKVKFRIK